MRALDLESGAALDATTLAQEGIYYSCLPLEPAAHGASLARLMREQGYAQQDQVELSPRTPNLDAICEKFLDEHYHDDDEVRFVLEGEGVFDIRSGADRWMRVLVQAGDLIVVPAKRHHRFLLTESRAIRCVRLFRDEAGWVPHYRQ